MSRARRCSRGPRGSDDYRRIVPDLRRLLARGGAAVLGIGWTQAEPVSAIARNSGFAVTGLYKGLESGRAVPSRLETTRRRHISCLDIGAAPAKTATG